MEDEIFIQLDLEQMLIAAGFEVVGVSDNAAHALRLAEQERPEAALVDIRLRGPRDGVDLAMELWNRFETRCLFISGNIDEAMKLRAAAAHPLGFVKKPFSTDHIVALLTSIYN